MRSLRPLACVGEALLASALAVATAAGATLFLAHNRAGKGLVLGGDFPRELFGVLHGSPLSLVRGSTV